MSAHPESGPTYTTGAEPTPTGARVDYATGFGWVVFAGTMLMLIGILNIVYGIAAIDDSSFFVGNAEYVISDLNTWGWVVLITGALQMLSGFGIWARNTLATWAGVFFAFLNGIGVLLLLPAYPLLSIALFAVDVLIIYGLLVHGGRAHQET